MKNFSTWLLAIFMVMFWLFRAIIALCTQYSVDMLGLVAYFKYRNNNSIFNYTMYCFSYKKKISRFTCIFINIWIVFWKPLI